MRFRSLSGFLIVVLLCSTWAQAADQAAPVGEKKFQTSAPAQAPTPIDTQVTVVKPAAQAPAEPKDNRDLAHGVAWLLKKIGQGARAYIDSFKSNRTQRVFHCKIP